MNTHPAVELRHGLAVAEVHNHLARGLWLRDTGQRILAFYLTEMATRRLHQRTGHSSTAQYAEARLGLEPRRTRELIAVGKALLALPAIDGAFCEERIGWSKVLLLMRVANPEHETAWLERALALNCRGLALEVRLSRAGGPPRKPGDRKGLPEVRFPVSMSLPTLAHRKFELAKQKLSAERGRPMTDAECVEAFAELFLDLEEDGSVEGRTRVSSSLYRIVLREDGPAGEVVADTELGPVPVADASVFRCDAEHVHADGTLPHGTLDAPTSPALRRRVLARDGHQCRACRSRTGLMVHHIRYRSKGGRTKSWNLITLCTSCHALVHDDLLVLEGRTAERIRFSSADGDAVAGSSGAIGAGPRLNRNGERSPPENSGSPMPPLPLKPMERAEAFAGIVGQDALLDRLDATARGSRARGKLFPHALFAGPPGTGKTTLSRGVAALVGARLHATCGPNLPDTGALSDLLSGVHKGEVVFIDEIHAVPRPVLEALYESLDSRRFTLLAATTEDGDLPDALHTRFGLRESLAFYDEDDLAVLAEHAARGQGVSLSPDAAQRLAVAARGTPRETLRLLERALDDAAAGGTSDVGRPEADATLRRLGFDDTGLDSTERRYLQVLRGNRSPLPLGRLARMLGLGRRTLLRHVEPFLFRRGLVRVTGRGRVAI